jgi:hypothetical protein
MKPRIDKAYYRTGPQLRLWLPLNRERRLWRAGAIHVREYRHQMMIRATLAMFDMKVGEKRGGVTLLAKWPPDPEKS